MCKMMRLYKGIWSIQLKVYIVCNIFNKIYFNYIEFRNLKQQTISETKIQRLNRKYKTRNKIVIKSQLS